MIRYFLFVISIVVAATYSGPKAASKSHLDLLFGADEV